MTRRHLFGALVGTTAVGARAGAGGMAQTPAGPLPGPRNMGDGRVAYPVLGFTLEPGVIPTLMAVLPAALPTRVAQATLNPDGTWQIPTLPTGPVMVTRNGVVMMPNLDYVVTGQVLTFSQVQGSDGNDVVGLWYQ